MKSFKEKIIPKLKVTYYNEYIFLSKIFETKEILYFASYNGAVLTSRFISKVYCDTSLSTDLLL